MCQHSFIPICAGRKATRMVIKMTKDLKTNISDFVKEFGCVSMTQIRYFFRDDPQDAVSWYVKTLLFERIFVRKGEYNIASRDYKGDFTDESINGKLICTRRKFGVSNDHIQNLITDSAWAAAYFGEKKIVHMTTTEFPCQSFFCTYDGKAYDVTVVYPGVEKPTIQAAHKVFQTSTVPSLDADYIEHIAVVYNQAGIDEVRKCGFFDYYIRLKNDMKTADLEEL